MEKFSVLMSVYNKEKPEYLDLALNSILASSILPDEVILVEDGPISKDIIEVIDDYRGQLNIVSVQLFENRGLAIALDTGLKKCKNQYVARMDTDDICFEQRFELQLNEFQKNKRLVLIGSDITEFTLDYATPTHLKKMPKTGRSIYKYSRKRNPFNHPTVMFKKDAVIKAGSYVDMPLFEDYYLWLRMLSIFELDQFKNIDQNLVSMRTVSDLYKRRGGGSYAKKVKNFRKTAYKEELISLSEYITSTALIAVVSIVPNKIRQVIYHKMLRKKI